MRSIFKAAIILAIFAWIIPYEGEYVLEVINDGKLVGYVTVYCSPADYERLKVAFAKAGSTEELAAMCSVVSGVWVVQSGFMEVTDQDYNKINKVIE